MVLPLVYFHGFQQFSDYSIPVQFYVEELLIGFTCLSLSNYCLNHLYFLIYNVGYELPSSVMCCVKKKKQCFLVICFICLNYISLVSLYLQHFLAI